MRHHRTNIVPYELLLIGVLSALALPCRAEQRIAPHHQSEDQSSAISRALADAFADLVEASIPVEYERRKDWGKMKTVTTGLKFEGFDIKRRRNEVKHGIWKHYRVQLRNPDEKLHVTLEDLQGVAGSRVRFVLIVDADLDIWARAKVYQHGIHMISLETTARTTMHLQCKCDVGVRIQSSGLLPTLVIDPHVNNTQFDLRNFKLERVSDARGPLVKELSKTVERLIEHEMASPKLAKKLNRAIDKKREKLVFSPDQLLKTSWWPLAELPDVARALKR